MITFIQQKILRLLLLLGCILPLFTVAQQGNNNLVSITVEKDMEHYTKTILSTLVKVTNNGTGSFKGYLQLALPEAFKSISPEFIAVDIAPKQAQYIPVRIQLYKSINSEKSDIGFQLLSQQKEILQAVTKTYISKAVTNLRLLADKEHYYLNNEDSIATSVWVVNDGNRTQQVTIVCHYPNVKNGDKQFMEQDVSVAAGEKKAVSFYFSTNFDKKNSHQPVIFTGLLKSDKQVFGSARVSIEKLSYNRTYYGPTYNGGLNINTDRFIQASHRITNEGNSITLLSANSYFNTANGNIGIKGSLQYIPGQELVASNTGVAYRSGHKEIYLGNISESLESTLFGRGGKLTLLSSQQDKELQIGYTDVNFNLLSRQDLGQNGYGVFSVIRLGPAGADKTVTGTAVFRKDPFEKIQFGIAGAQTQFHFLKRLRATMAVYGANSHYYAVNKNAGSGAVSFDYFGEVSNKARMYGSYYYSTPYYPGNRRGVLSIQQNLDKKVNEKTNYWINISVDKYAPKSHNLIMDVFSNNMQGTVGFNRQATNNFNYAIAFQAQLEKTNAFKQILPENIPQLPYYSYRFVENLSLSSFNRKHRFSINIQNGISQNPLDSKYQLHLRTNATYAIHKLTLNYIQQYGSFLYSEYISTVPLFYKTFSRNAFAAVYNEQLFHKKLLVNIGASYFKNYNATGAPSGFVDLRYNTHKNYILQLNANYYAYTSVEGHKSSILSVEAGVRINFKNNQAASTQKKAHVKAFVFYDKNSNGIFDAGDEAAPGFVVTVDNHSFSSDKNGQFNYYQLPYGCYVIQPISTQGWFYAGSTLVVKQHKMPLAIALQQTGSVMGYIKYDYGSRTAYDIQPQSGGIVFKITQNDTLLQTVITDEQNGAFSSFLPTGTYHITLDETSLPENTYCEQPQETVTIYSGKLTTLRDFIIKVKEKKRNVKYFGDSKTP